MPKPTPEAESIHQRLMNSAYARWQATEGMTQAEFWSGLSLAERVAVFAGNLNYQVENGGFVQWYDNGYSACREELRFICHRIGTPAAIEVADVLDRVGAIISSAPPRGFVGDREDDWDVFYYKLEQLDKTYDAVATAFLADVEAYLAREEAAHA
jgi:hypothetical protein